MSSGETPESHLDAARSHVPRADELPAIGAGAAASPQALPKQDRDPYKVQDVEQGIHSEAAECKLCLLPLLLGLHVALIRMNRMPLQPICDLHEELDYVAQVGDDAEEDQHLHGEQQPRDVQGLDLLVDAVGQREERGLHVRLDDGLHRADAEEPAVRADEERVHGLEVVVLPIVGHAAPLLHVPLHPFQCACHALECNCLEPRYRGQDLEDLLMVRAVVSMCRVLAADIL
mmetsp:Transcript_107351/g.335806  ORF Transcript_107351/g.335806 Transcript_107351/m.335806 type:complete len:231 (-) Transcript_107351:917-1609(-)